MTPKAPNSDFLPALGHSQLAHSQAQGEFRSFPAFNADARTFKSTVKMVASQTGYKTVTPKDFHRDMFDQKVMKADMRTVFTEYAWDMNWCDPCAADPLSHEELRSLGFFWLTETPPDFVPGRGPRPIMPPMGGARDAQWRQGNEERRLADFAGWKLTDIPLQKNLHTADAGSDGKWWQKLWTS